MPKKGKCLANDYLMGERDSEAIQCVLITMDYEVTPYGFKSYILAVFFFVPKLNHL